MVKGGYFFPDTHWLSFTLSLGRGTDNWAKLRTLASLLRITIEKEIVELQVLSDSRAVIDWI